jgi:hypothetical protein
MRSAQLPAEEEQTARFPHPWIKEIKKKKLKGEKTKYVTNTQQTFLITDLNMMDFSKEKIYLCTIVNF